MSHMGPDLSQSASMTASVPPALAGGFGAPASSGMHLMHVQAPRSAGRGYDGYDPAAAPPSESVPPSGLYAAAATAELATAAHNRWSVAGGAHAPEATTGFSDAAVSSPLAAAEPGLPMSTGLGGGLSAPTSSLDGMDDIADMVATRSAFALLAIEEEGSALCPGPIAGGASAVFAQAQGTGFW